MCYCILKVKNLLGKEVKSAIKISTAIESAEELNELIESETELSLIAEEFIALQQKCTQVYGDRLCQITVEIKTEEKFLVPQTTIKVPCTAEADLRKFLLHVKDFCTKQIEIFLANVPNVEMNSVSFKIPAFFNGDMDKVISY